MPPTVITTGHEIQALLMRLIAERTPLSVFLPEAGAPFGSLLLGLDGARRQLLADALHPAEGHRRAAPGLPLHVVTRLQGIELRFRTRIDAVGDDSYRLALPRELDYRQRRRAYRTRVPAAYAIEARLQVEADEPRRARLVDVSIEGVALGMRAADAPAPGTCMRCAIELPVGTLEAMLEIRSVRYEPSTPGACSVGASFAGLSHEQQRLLGRFTAVLQRRLLRARRQAAP